MGHNPHVTATPRQLQTVPYAVLVASGDDNQLTWLGIYECPGDVKPVNRRAAAVEAQCDNADYEPTETDLFMVFQLAESAPALVDGPSVGAPVPDDSVGDALSDVTDAVTTGDVVTDV